MAIIQISKQQQRSGDLVDLPQLSEAEFGWATDEKRLFIGKETPNENIEVLTSYSIIDFNQINGSFGNLNISNTVADGELLVYNGNAWVNRGGAAGGLITLGDVSDIRIDGGSVNYVLSTDGSGNLTWEPKGALYTNILGLSSANPIVMTVANTTPYVNDAQVTITGVSGTNASIVNGQTFYVRLAIDFPTSGNVSLYTSSGAVGPVDGTTLTYTGNGVATTSLGGSGGAGVVGGSNTQIQYNNGSGFAADANLVWNYSTRVLTVTGNTVSGNITASGTIAAGTITTGALSASSQITSTVSTGTAPLVVASTTKVTNLNADLLDGYDTSAAAAATTIVLRDANANVIANSVSTNRIFNGTSNVAITASGNVTITVAGSERFRATTTGANVTGDLTITGNTIPAGIKTDNYYYANGVAISFSGTYSNANVASYLPTYTGNITAANVTTSSHVIRSVGVGISAAGTVQGDSTLLSKDINVVSTVSAGQGVRLPVAIAGMVIIVNNTSANALNVYPSTGGAINSLATNIAYSHVAGASLQYYAVSATQWYTVGATYS